MKFKNRESLKLQWDEYKRYKEDDKFNTFSLLWSMFDGVLYSICLGFLPAFVFLLWLSISIGYPHTDILPMLVGALTVPQYMFFCGMSLSNFNTWREEEAHQAVMRRTLDL